MGPWIFVGMGQARDGRSGAGPRDSVEGVAELGDEPGGLGFGLVLAVNGLVGDRDSRVWACGGRGLLGAFAVVLYRSG